jgi:hypothetical protein
MIAIGLDLEMKKVTEVNSSSALKLGVNSIGRTNESNIEVARCSCTFEAKFQDHASFRNGPITELVKDPCQKAIEKKHLPQPGHPARSRRSSDPLLESL